MADDLVRRAADMLLGGATLAAEPCPYCGGVRVIRAGRALCTGCGSEPEEREVPEAGPAVPGLEGALGRKLGELSARLEAESDPARQQEILGAINAVLDTMKRAGGRQ